MKSSTKKTTASNPYAIGKDGRSPATNGKKPTKMVGESHSYDSARPKRPVVSRYSK